MDHNDYQFGEDNRRWLSLLPLFETEHWPIECYGPDGGWCSTCICDTDVHDTVSLFPYARYGAVDALHEMSRTLFGVYEYYADYSFQDSVLHEISASWPDFFRDIFLDEHEFEDDRWCLNPNIPCHNSPYHLPHWATDECTYTHCLCDEHDDYEGESMEEDRYFPISIIDDFIMPILFAGDSYAIPGRYGSWIDDRPIKGYSIGYWEPYDFQITGYTSETDNPPAYNTVSELPSYEDITKPPRYENIFW